MPVFGILEVNETWRVGEVGLWGPQSLLFKSCFSELTVQRSWLCDWMLCLPVVNGQGVCT